MRAHIVLVLSLLFALSSCQQDTSGNQNLTTTRGNFIIEKNDRTQLDDKSQLEHPYNLIGKLVTDYVYDCTASLIGEDLALTAAHCVVNRHGQISNNIVFKLALNNGEAIDRARVIADESVVGSLTKYRAQPNLDWAIIKLDKALGKKYGHFDLRMSPNIEAARDITISFAGYSGITSNKNSMDIQDNCQFRDTVSRFELFSHDCDSNGGDSGAPLFECHNNRCYIMAVHIGSIIVDPDRRTQKFDGNSTIEEYSENQNNITVTVKNYFQAAQTMRLQSKLKN